MNAFFNHVKTHAKVFGYAVVCGLGAYAFIHVLMWAIGLLRSFVY